MKQTHPAIQLKVIGDVTYFKYHLTKDLEI